MASSYRSVSRLLVLVAIQGLASLHAHAQAATPPPETQDTSNPVQRDAFLRGERLTDHVRLVGLLQVDEIAWDQSSMDELDPATRQPLNQERFTLSRAWLGCNVRYGMVRGQFSVEGTTKPSPNLHVLLAELGVAYPSQASIPLVELSLGVFFLPFGFETQEYIPSRLFLEQATWSNALFPGRRDLGARVQGGWSFLRYAFALTNGNPSEGSLGLQDPNRAKDLLGRLGAEGELFPWLRATAGVSGLIGRGFHPGQGPTKAQLVVNDINEDGIVQLSELTLVPGTPGDASRNFDRNALGADLAFDYLLPQLGAGRLYGEVAWAQNLDRGLFVADPVAQGRNLRELGLMAAFRQYVTHHVELGARYDYYDPDRDASRRSGVSFVPSNASFSTITGVLAWCSLPHLRVTLQYDHRTNPLGRTTSGNPTTLAADSLTLRGQLSL